MGEILEFEDVKKR